MATQKQIRVFNKLAENGGKSVSGAMREVGYTPITAATPKKLTESKGWKELLEERLPDNLLTNKHLEGLEATRTISAIGGKEANGGTVDFVDVPDFAVREGYLKMAYQLKDKFPAAKQRFVDEQGKDKDFIVALTDESYTPPDAEQNSP